MPSPYSGLLLLLLMQLAATLLCSTVLAKPMNLCPLFLTSILSSLHLALKKNNITKFPNVYSRVRNSSSSTPVVVDVSQTWQASLCYLPSCFTVSSLWGDLLFSLSVFLITISPSFESLMLKVDTFSVVYSPSSWGRCILVYKSKPCGLSQL